MKKEQEQIEAQEKNRRREVNIRLRNPDDLPPEELLRLTSPKLQQTEAEQTKNEFLENEKVKKLKTCKKCDGKGYKVKEDSNTVKTCKCQKT